MLIRFLIHLSILLVGAAHAQSLQVATSTMKKFSAAGVPGIITNSRLGDLYLNTTDKNIFVCTNRDSYCTSIGTGQWQPFTFIGTAGSIPVSDGVKSVAVNLSNCKNNTTDKLLFDLDNLKFVCGTDQNGGGAISSINSLTTATQVFAIGSTGTDFNIVSSGSTHTFHFPTASGSNRGLLSSTDWSTFNGKESVLTFNGALSRSGNTITCLTASGSQFGCLSTTDWTTFNNKQAALGFTPLNPANNLSELASAATARTNLGLGNVDNTSDATKNSAVATLTNKTLTAPVINSPTGLVKGDVGLGNVDNTSDATKNAAVATLTNKTLTSPVINTPTGIVKGDVGLGNVPNVDTSNASNITSGTLPDARLSSNVTLDNATNVFTGTNDFSGAARTAPAKAGTSLPGTCTVGDQYFKTDATAGQNLYFCTATNTWTQQLNSGGSGGCDVYSVGTAAFSFADATTYYIGVFPTRSPTSTAASYRAYFPRAGTITAANVAFFNTGTGSAETSTISIRINNTTDYTISSSVVNNSQSTYFQNTSLSISVSAGDYFEFKWVTPTWVTNPTNVIVSGVVCY